jgi:hypothetical protein
MSSSSTIARRPRARWPASWWIAVALVFLVQLGLMFWVGDAPAPTQTHTAPVPNLQLVGTNSAPALALLDPTLFALPHREGFAQAWLTLTNQPYRPFTWNDEPAALELPVQSLGSAFAHFVATNFPFSAPQWLLPEPEPQEPEPARPEMWPTHSTWLLAGGLENRELLTPLDLRSWTSSDLLTNSIIRVLVDAQGRPVSAALLAPGSGSREADAFALAQARTARFNPVAASAHLAGNPLSGLTWGNLIFQWHTVPATPARAQAAK